MKSSLTLLCCRFLPGIVLCGGVCLVAFGLQIVGQGFFGHLFPEALVLSILFGALLRGLADQGWFCDLARFEEGIGLSAHFLLECAVMLLGASIPLATLLHSGARIIAGVVIIVSLSIVVSYCLARALRLLPRLSLLLACGNAICGNSAIIAIAPVIGAKAREIAPAIAFTAVLGVVAVLLMPLALPLFSFSPYHYGVFAGMTVYAVPQVLAATAPVSVAAMQSATVVKLMRVLMLGPLILILSLMRNRHETGKEKIGKSARLLQLVPWFIIGFGLLMALRSADVIPAPLLSSLAMVATILTNLAMAALGLGCDIAALGRSGGRVIFAAFLSLLSLGLMAVLFCRLFI